MPTLNRFPLLGLWAREAARRIGYSTPDAEAIGHAYALLYAIRANIRSVPAKAAENKAGLRRSRGVDELAFSGDTLDVAYDDAGHVQGVVGGDRPQTPRSYRTSIANKFPPGYLAAVAAAFQKVLSAYPPRTLDSKLVHDIYDEWKRACAVGRRVDLDCVLDWCHRRAAGTDRKRQATAARPAVRRSSKSRASSRAAPPTSLLK
jgi:hypothetical protein